MEGTFYQMCFDLLLYVLTYVLSKNNKKFNNNNTAVYSLIILFCIYPFWGGDYFHYLESYIDYKKSNAYTWIDPIYDRIMDYSPSYAVFRILVWGSGFTSILLASRNFYIKTSQFLFIFTVFLLLIFSYARVSLGMSILLLGYSLILNSKNNIIKIGLGIITILISMIFHKSLILPILVAFISIININKKMLVFIFVLLPIIILILRNNFETIAYTSGILNEDQMFKVERYTNGENPRAIGIAAIINNILQYFPIYFSILFLTKAYYKYDSYLDHCERSLYRFSLFLFLASNVFIFIPNAFTLFYRMLALSRFPILFTICKYKDLIPVKQIKIFITASLISSVYMLLYAIYLTR